MHRSLICALALCSASALEVARVLNFQKPPSTDVCHNPTEHEDCFCPNGTLAVRIGGRVHTIKHITICNMTYDHDSICTLLEGLDLSVAKGESHVHFAAGDNRLTISNADVERITQLLTETKERESGVDITDVCFHVKLTGMLGMLLPNEGTCDLRFRAPKETERTVAKISAPAH